MKTLERGPKPSSSVLPSSSSWSSFPECSTIGSAPLRWHETTNILRLTGTLYFSELASGYVGPVLSGNSRRCSIPRTVKRNRRVHGRDWSPLPTLHDRGSLGESTSVPVAHGQSTRDTLLRCSLADVSIRSTVRDTMGGPSRQINGEVCPSGLVLPRSPSKLLKGRTEEREREIRERFCE